MSYSLLQIILHIFMLNLALTHPDTTLFLKIKTTPQQNQLMREIRLYHFCAFCKAITLKWQK